ncbi:MAG TPA: hypothetical protein VFH11_01300 [Gemmatimonadota bacterium]|nr:hypothetical protein [Gemmatimonadota bacterium]
MPFTPFHFGPGLFGKSILARHFSWIAFAAAQVAIDCETLYYLLQRTYPVHRFFHTFLGATIAGIAIGACFIGLRVFLQKQSVVFTTLIDGLRPTLRSELTNAGLMVGALAGGISHPFLDGIVHQDVHPFGPWSDENPLLRFIDLEALHIACIGLGLAGLVVVLMRLYRETL